MYVQASPAFLKFAVILLSFYERPTLVPVFSNGKKSKEDFHFYKKRLKVRTASCFCLAAAAGQGVHTPSRERALQAPSLGTPLSISASSRHGCELCL